MRSSKIAVITYYFPHRKTQDVVFKLRAKGYTQVELLALPFVPRARKKTPIYAHRPSHCLDLYPDVLAQRYAYNFRKITTDTLRETLTKIRPDTVLIAGAGILPKEVVQHFKIINSHPAYLPLVRGLDALKWAIANQQKIGVTTHFISEEADAGWLIDRKEVPVYAHDTFHLLAYRQYELEIDMLVNSVEKVEEKTMFPELEKKGEVQRRMPIKIEKDLLLYFDKYKSKFAKKEK